MAPPGRLCGVAIEFRWALGHYPDYAERYMVHQQGIQGAIEHYTHPERVAWQSMCATDEGVLKGEPWCRKCIWRNLLRNGRRASEMWRRYQAETSSLCGQDASITSPTDSVWRRMTRRQVHTPKAMHRLGRCAPRGSIALPDAHGETAIAERTRIRKHHLQILI